jgi:putative transposase
MKHIEKHRRRAVRLKGYDYSRAGAYFVTVCTQSKLNLFGDIVDGAMQLNNAGRMVEKWWIELNHKFDNVETDEYIIMPNHFHGIIILTTANPMQDAHAEGTSTGTKDAHTGAKGTHIGAESTHIGAKGAHIGAKGAHIGAKGAHIGAKGAHIGAKGAHIGAPLQEIMQWLKTMTTNEYIRGVKQSGWRPFPGKLWQRSYYDHIIRNENELNLAREYIMYNPIRWPKDKYNVELLH